MSILKNIPNDWTIDTIENVFDFISTKSLSRAQLTTEKSEYQYIHYGDIHSTFKYTLVDTETVKLPNVMSNVKINGNIDYLKEGDLVIADASEDLEGVAKCIELKNIKNKKIIGGLHTIVCRDNKGKTVNGFRTYLLTNPEVLKSIRRIATGASVLGISKGRLKEIKLILPSIKEQKKIAEILSTVDDKIELIDQQITQNQELKKGLMQRLLTKGIGHTEFKDSPLGVIPKSWEVVELDEISSTTRLAGYEYSEYWEESTDGEITALRGYNIGKNKLLLHNVIRISEELSQKLIRSRLFKGDVVFPCVGTIGNAIVIEDNDKYHINQNIAKITPNNNLDSYFLMQYLISPMCRKEIKRFNATTSQPNVLVGSLRKFRIPFPNNIKEQKKISNILNSVDGKLEILLEKKLSYQKLKQGLMQQLLTGKIRVKV